MANQRLTFEVGAEAVNVDQVKKKIQSIDDEITKLQKHAQDIRISEKGGTDIGKDLVKGIEKAIEELKGIQKSYTNILTGLSNQKIDTKQFEDFANSVNGRLEAVEKQVLGLEESLTKLVSRFEKKLPVQVLQGQVDSLTSRFNAFTESTDKAIRALSNFNDLVSKNTAKPKETTIKVDTSQLEKVETLIKKFETDDILGGNSNLTIRTDTAVKNLTELYEKYQSLSTELSKTKDAKQISSLQVQLAELLPEMAQIANRIMELKKLNIDDVYAGLGENISLGKLGNFAKIFEFIDNQIGITSTRLGKMRDEMKSSLESVTSEATTEVSQFTFKNGGIRVPVTIDASSKKALESKYNEIVSELQNYANVHPVNVTMRLFPLNTNRAGATEITNELKRIQTDINSVEDPELKVKLNSLYDDLEAQFKKALNLKIKVDLGDSTVSLKQRIKELQQAVKDEGFTIYPTFDISEEEAKKITSVLAKVQESASLDFNEEFRKTADALNKLTSNGDISKWSEQFAEGLGKAYAKLEEMQPLIQTLTFFFATKKSAKDSILSKTDVSSITALSQAINALQDAIEKIQTLDLSKLDNADFGQKIQSELSNMKPITIPIEPDLSNINSFITKLEDALSKANIDLNLGAKTQKSKSLQEYVQDKDVANAMYKDIYKRLDEVADNVGTPLKKKIAVSLVEGLRNGLSSVSEMLQEGLKGTKFESITDQLIGDKETIDGIKNIANEVAVNYINALNTIETKLNFDNIIQKETRIGDVGKSATTNLSEGIRSSTDNALELFDALSNLFILLKNNEQGNEGLISFNSKTKLYNSSFGENGFVAKTPNNNGADYNIHTHPWGDNEFSKNDLNQFTLDLKEGIRHQLLLSLNGLLDLDLGKMTPEDLSSIINEYENFRKQIIENAKNSLTLKDVYDTEDDFKDMIKNKYGYFLDMDENNELFSENPLAKLGTEIYKALTNEKEELLSSLLKEVHNRVGDFSSNDEWFLQIEREIDAYFYKIIQNKLSSLVIDGAKAPGLPAVQKNQILDGLKQSFNFQYGFADEDILSSIISYKLENDSKYAGKIFGSINSKLYELIKPYGGNLTEVPYNEAQSYLKNIAMGDTQKTVTSVREAAEAIKEEGVAAEQAATLKQKFSEANKEVASSAELTANATKEAAGGINAEGEASKNASNKSKKPKEYDEKTAIKGAQLIEAELNRQTQNLDFDGYITSIQRMYDSHDYLAQALITAERTVQDSTGELVKQTQKLNIKYDKNGGIAYTSTMEADNYKATANAAEKERRALEKERQATYKQMQKEASNRQNEEEVKRQNEINNLLIKQATAYKNVLGIRTQIAKLDPQKNSEQIQELEKQKKDQLEIYANTTRQLKAIDENANAEAQVNQLLEMRKKSIAEINAIQAKQSDKEYNDYRAEISKGLEQVSNLSARENITPEYESRLKTVRDTLNDLSEKKIDVVTDKELSDLEEALTTLKELTRTANAADNKVANENTVSKSLGRINDILSKNTRLSFRNTDVYRDFVALQDAFQNFNTDRPQSELNELVKALNKTDAEFKALDDSVKGTGFFGNFIHRLSDMNAKFLATYFSFQDIVRYARSAFNAVQDLNKQMVELAKVSDQSLSQIQGDFSDYAKTAKGLGATISDTISATADWARFNKIDPLYGNI